MLPRYPLPFSVTKRGPFWPRPHCPLAIGAAGERTSLELNTIAYWERDDPTMNRYYKQEVDAGGGGGLLAMAFSISTVN